MMRKISQTCLSNIYAVNCEIKKANHLDFEIERVSESYQFMCN